MILNNVGAHCKHRTILSQHPACYSKNWNGVTSPFGHVLHSSSAIDVFVVLSSIVAGVLH